MSSSHTPSYEFFSNKSHIEKTKLRNVFDLILLTRFVLKKQEPQFLLPSATQYF